jgi:glyoxylase-like metal-dependent hydrolase (beta-lactamase superfamily II)
MTVIPIPTRRLITVHAFLVLVEGKALLFDTGLPGTLETVCGAIRAAGVEPSGIVLSHAHFDHMANLADLAERYPRADVFVSNEPEALATGRGSVPKYMGRHQAFRGVSVFLGGLLRSRPFIGGTLLRDGLELPPFGTIVRAPGHCAEHYVLHLPSGDCLCADAWVSDRGRPEPNTYWDDEAQTRASARAILQRTQGTLYPAHGRPFSVEQAQKAMPS